MTNRKGEGFTLIELLIVIAILAILSTVVVLVLNPAELLRQARDSTRISDLGAINSAIALYLADVSNPSWTATGSCTSGATKPPGMSQECDANATTTVTGSGWVGVVFSDISAGSPLAKLPMDPNNGSSNCDGGGVDLCMYVFAKTTNETYELNANMESVKFGKGGSSDVEINTKDGGDDDDWYEIGSSLTL